MMIGSVRDFIVGNLGEGVEFLDFGCGSGECGLFAERLGCSVVFADVYKNSNLLRDVIIVDGNEALPWNDGMFDFVICEEVIEHLYNHEGFVKELLRVTKKGGRVLLTTPNVKVWYSGLIFLWKGELIWFNDDFNKLTQEGDSFHVRPLILDLFRKYLDKLNVKYVIRYDDATIPLLHFKLPINSRTGMHLVIELIK